jgi:LysM repeat protein
MIRRLLNGLVALLLLGLGLVGLPAFLLGAYRALDAQMPDLVDLPSVLLSPGDGGLFLLLVLAIGWVCWAVFTAAFAVEVGARARGIRTPHLGAFFPQATIAQAVSSVALMLTLTPVAAHAIPVTPAPAAAPTITTSQASTLPTAASAQGQSEAEPAQQEAEEAHLDYVVERGDTLWDIADEQLDDPTRYPEIVESSEGIAQPDGRQLTDPDLILPGWTLHVPAEQDQAVAPVDEPASEIEAAEVPTPATAEDAPEPADPVLPPTTPMQSLDPGSQDDTSAAGVFLPTTPLAAPAAQASSPTGDGPAVVAAGPADLVTPPLPSTPMGAAGERPVDPPDTVTAREAVYDDEGRFAPTHGVLGLPNWITAPLIPTRPEDAPELIAEAEAILARYSAAQAATRAAGGRPTTTMRKAT